MHGTFDNNLPKLKFRLSGVDKAQPQEFEGIIDTGCNGYLFFPLVKALPLGVKLVGVEQSTIANNTTMSSLVCEGHIEVFGTTIPTIISLQDGPILIGTQLLAKLGKDLHIDFSTGAYQFKDKTAPKPKQQSKNTP